MSAEGPGALARLAHKYRVIRDLREARARGEPAPEAHVFKALAREMPGALRELDVLPMEIIEARIEAIDRAIATGSAEPWMRWILDVHALLREALRIKAIAGKRGLGDDDVRAIVERAAREGQASIDEAFVRAVAAPPGGRIQPIVIARVASIHGVSREAIATILFTKSR